MVHQIAMGYVLGKIYWIIFKIIGIIVLPFWIALFGIVFAYTYKPSPKELEYYPPILSSSLVQESLSHLRYNLRVVLGSMVPIDPKQFPDMNADEIKHFPKKEDAFLTKKQPIIYRELAMFIPMYQKQISGLYVKMSKKTKDHFKDKPINNLDWEIIKQ